MKPRRLDSLRLAVWRNVATIPNDMARRAILGFPKRVRMCAPADGGAFKHRKPAREDIVDVPISQGTGADDAEDG